MFMCGERQPTDGMNIPENLRRMRSAASSMIARVSGDAPAIGRSMSLHGSALLISVNTSAALEESMLGYTCAPARA